MARPPKSIHDSHRKRFGEYYTGADIAGYISCNAIGVFLLNHLVEGAVAGRLAEGSIGRLLRVNPDRYISPSLRHGTRFPLPPSVTAGLADVDRRKEWNRPAPPQFALPTETWRDAIARRRLYEDTRQRLAAGMVRSAADWITWNLDIGLFLHDAVGLCDRPSFNILWRALRRLAVLDPTCGQGDFLLAAMDVLEPIYAACLDRLAAERDPSPSGRGRGEGDSSPSGRGQGEGVFPRSPLARTNRHLFILQAIVTNNLYGLDIVEDAVEQCRRLLRRRLLDAADGKPPSGLDDAGANVRMGNALVGYVDYCGMGVSPMRPQTVSVRSLRSISSCDQLLARQYGVDASGKRAFARWLDAHCPFHWFIEFPQVMKRGGFDVVIGNPPYVEYSRSAGRYRLVPQQYRTASADNLHAFVLERALRLRRPAGTLGMIVPLSAFCTRRMAPLIRIVKDSAGAKWFSHFGWRPAKLFEDVNIPLSILLAAPGRPAAHTTTFQKWYGPYRPHLFGTIRYAPCDDLLIFDHVIPKIGSEIERAILKKLFLRAQGKSLADYVAAAGGAKPATRNPQPATTLYYRNTGGLYWRIITDFPPLFEQDGRQGASSTAATLVFKDARTLSLAAAALNSNLFWFFYVVFSSFHHVNPRDLLEFPIDLGAIAAPTARALIAAKDRLMADLRRHSEIRTRRHKGGNVSRAQTFFPSASKPLVDRIDAILAAHYGLSAEELDFIVNYDIRFRIGHRS